MITETVSNVLQCTDQQEYAKAAEKVSRASLPANAQVIMDPILLRITINVTRQVTL